MKRKKLIITVALGLCTILQSSHDGTTSPKTLAHHLSDADLLVVDKKMIDDNDDNDLEYSDTVSDLDQGLFIPVLQSKDIEALDQYSGYDEQFDRLYKFAKRDLYLAQQNERLFPDRAHSYDNLKKYYQELFGQRKRMVYIKKALGEKTRGTFDSDKLDMKKMSQKAQKKLSDLKFKSSQLYHNNVQRSMNPKLLSDYKVPYDVQLQINEIDLAIAQFILDEFSKNS